MLVPCCMLKTKFLYKIYTSLKAVVVQFPITLDVPIGLVQLSSFSSSLLTISYNQLFAVNKFNYVAGMSYLCIDI